MGTKKATTTTTPTKITFWRLVLLLLGCCCFLTTVVDADYIHSYSVSIDFGEPLALAQFSDEIVGSPSITSVFLTALELGDDLDIHFNATLSAPEVTALDALVAAHLPFTAEEKICRQLPDADTDLTLILLSVGVLEAIPTAPRTYRYPTAAALAAPGLLRADLSVINTGAAVATVTTQTGGTMHGDTDVAAGTSGHFRYSVTNATPGAEAYMLLRIA